VFENVRLGVDEADGVKDALGVREGVTDTVKDGVFDPVVV
jgi:hypothetical protein